MVAQAALREQSNFTLLTRNFRSWILREEVFVGDASFHIAKRVVALRFLRIDPFKLLSLTADGRADDSHTRSRCEKALPIRLLIIHNWVQCLKLIVVCTFELAHLGQLLRKLVPEMLRYCDRSILDIKQLLRGVTCCLILFSVFSRRFSTSGVFK